MQIDLVYGVALANGASADLPDIQERLEEAGAFGFMLPEAGSEAGVSDETREYFRLARIAQGAAAPSVQNRRVLLSYGGSNNDGALYAGVVLSGLFEGYGSKCVSLDSAAKSLAAANGSLVEAFDLWWASPEADQVRSLCEGPFAKPSALIVMDSD